MTIRVNICYKLVHQTTHGQKEVDCFDPSPESETMIHNDKPQVYQVELECKG